MQKTKDAIVFTRSGFCQACYYANRPQRGEYVLVYGSSTQRLHIKQIAHFGTRGFTPWIITLEGVTQDGLFKLYYSCGVVGCDCDIEEKFYLHGKEVSEDDDYDDTKVFPIFKKAHTLYLTGPQYHALKNFKDTGYEV